MNTHTKALVLFFAFTFISCDKEYNTLGSDIIAAEHFDFETYLAEHLNSYIKSTDPVQTNNLPINDLGIYRNPVFGTTKAHFVSQIEMLSSDPDVGFNSYIDPVKDSIYVYIPFYSTLKSTNDAGERKYELDSIYGDTLAKFKLKVYENGYNIRDFDPTDNNQSAQKYYSDFKQTIDNNRGAILLNDSDDVSQNLEFSFNKNEIIIYKTNGNGAYLDSNDEVTTDPDAYVIKERKLPGIWLKLGNQPASKDFFQTKFLDAVAQGKLYNNNVFKQHFKGLYFEVEELASIEGSMAKLDFSNAEIALQFHYYAEDEITDETLSLKSSLRFQMGYNTTGTKNSNSINLLEFSDISPAYATALANTNNDEKLFLKGGVNGTVAYIDVFDDNELAILRANNWLINEANLVFYIDQTAMANAEYEPQRIYLYDATNNTPLLDFYSDPTSGSSPKINKYIHGGILEKDSNEKGLKYKIRITDYINNVLNGTNPNNNGNSRLGLVVSESINLIGNARLKNPIIFGADDETKYIPVSSIMHPIGTVLHGTQSTATYTDDQGNVIPMRLKLEIYYTKPN